MTAILSMIGVRSLLLCLVGARSAAADSYDRCQILLAHPRHLWDITERTTWTIRHNTGLCRLTSEPC